MKKNVLILIILCALTGVVIAQTITTRINKIDVDFNRNIATVDIGTGYYDEGNVWHTVGVETESIIQEPAFDQMINELSQSNALNMNAVIQTLLVELTPQSPLSTTVNWDQLAQLKSIGTNWTTIKTIMTGINWSGVSALNNITGTNWTSLTGINWNNWFTVEGQGQNWEQFIKTNGN